ncbi:MAG: hypothetical protein ACOYN0_12885 [Phycisphaerales bacterium]
MKPSRSSATRLIAAFSLIEVLISVVVLALGLLGLAAVFPAVIRQQKDVIVARTSDSARSSLRELFSRTSRTSEAPNFIDWEFLAQDSLLSASAAPTECPLAIKYTGQWQIAWDWDGLDAGIATDYARFGDIEVGGGVHFDCIPAVDGTEISTDLRDRNVAEVLDREPTFLYSYARLFPEPFSGLDPEYVWDFVPRKTPNGVVQVAVFVRQVDPGIVVPRGSSLSKELLGTVDAGNLLTRTVIPVAESIDGVPTGNGRGVYSRVRSTVIRIDRDDPSIVYVTTGSPGNESDLAIARKGQKFVDSLDPPSVQTIVERVRTGNGYTLTLSPGYGEQQRNLQFEVIFTPQLAVEAFVETVR